jgi:hypothetical protein
MADPLRDRADDHRTLRKEVFGFELVPLPRNWQLSAADSLTESGHQSECAGEFPTRDHSVNPSVIRSSSDD